MTTKLTPPADLNTLTAAALRVLLGDLGVTEVSAFWSVLLVGGRR